jgi:hypothetical protein
MRPTKAALAAQQQATGENHDALPMLPMPQGSRMPLAPHAPNGVVAARPLATTKVAPLPRQPSAGAPPTEPAPPHAPKVEPASAFTFVPSAPPTDSAVQHLRETVASLQADLLAERASHQAAVVRVPDTLLGSG